MSGSDRRDETFASRWSRLKTAPEPEPVVEEAALAEAPPAEPAPVEDERSDEEILAELGLPDPTTLGPGDDVRGFMEAAVPDRLRRIALRQLWRSNPVLANVDGLVEYGEDYTDAATVIENMQTVYQVGKGMVAKWMEEDEDEEKGAEGDELAAEAEVAADPEPAEQDAPEFAEVDGVEAETADLTVEDDLAAQEEVEMTAPTRRRMAFSFDAKGASGDR